MLVLEWKERVFIEKVNSRCFCWFPAAILVHQNGTPIWRLHTKLYKGAWNVSANNSETVGHKELRLGYIVHILVFYNISFFLSSSTRRFPINYFLVAWQWKRSIEKKWWLRPWVCRLWVVPHFSSGIVERAKRERAWKSPHARKGDFARFTISEEKWGTTRRSTGLVKPQNESQIC